MLTSTARQTLHPWNRLVERRSVRALVIGSSLCRGAFASVDASRVEAAIVVVGGELRKRLAKATANEEAENGRTYVVGDGRRLVPRPPWLHFRRWLVVCCCVWFLLAEPLLSAAAAATAETTGSFGAGDRFLFVAGPRRVGFWLLVLCVRRRRGKRPPSDIESSRRRRRRRRRVWQKETGSPRRSPMDEFCKLRKRASRVARR